MNAMVWFGAGTLCLWGAANLCRPRLETPPTASPLIVSQAGRDQAALRLIGEARTSIYLRTERLTLIPAGNELVQAIQRKAAVTLELPLGSGCDVEASQLPLILMEQGAVVSYRSDPAASGKGTFLVVDGNRFLYSAMPLTLCEPGAQVSYVAGPLGR